MKNEIKQKAREYYLNEVINGDTCDDKDGWTDCFVSGAKALMQLPLCDRLTAAEKERVKGLHYHLTNVLAYCHPSADKIVEATIHDIESIFGKELFGEGEG